MVVNTRRNNIHGSYYTDEGVLVLFILSILPIANTACCFTILIEYINFPNPMKWLRKLYDK